MKPRRAAPRLLPHPFAADIHPNWRGERLCRCGQLADAACHQIPDVDPEVTAEQQRRLGEHPEREDNDHGT